MNGWSATKLNDLLRRVETLERFSSRGDFVGASVDELRACREQRLPVKPKRAQPRRGPMRDPKYRAWCKRQRCAMLPQFGLNGALDNCKGWDFPDPAHTQNNGMSSKGPDSSCVPLCRVHHREYDAGREAFEKKYGVDMKAIAKEHYERYLKEQQKWLVRK